MIPTGEIRPVAGTPFEITTPHTIGERINDQYDQLILGKGYDHNFVLDNIEPVDVHVYDLTSGRVLEVITDQPGMQLYTGNFLDGTKIGHGGKPYISDQDCALNPATILIAQIILNSRVQCLTRATHLKPRLFINFLLNRFSFRVNLRRHWKEIISFHYRRFY